MKVTGKKILVEQFLTSTETEGGIVLPDSSVKKVPRGKVLYIGGDVTEVEVDDVVLINDLAGLAVEINKVPLLVLLEEDVLVILEEGDED